MSAREWGPELHAGDEWEGDGIRVEVLRVRWTGLAEVTLMTDPRHRFLRLYPWGKWAMSHCGWGTVFPSTMAAFVACYGLTKTR